jgi:hypothetical protein
MHAIAVAQAAYLFAPLLVASLLSAIVLKLDLLRFLKHPIDGGRSWRGRRLFGDNKTWRGVVVAVLGCIAGVAVQRYVIGAQVGAIAVVRYEELDVILFGAAMGGGAMLGELPNSFAKRQLGISPGKTTTGPQAIGFYVWDQVDLLTGAWPLLACWISPRVEVVLASFALVVIIHPTISVVGYVIGARKSAR